MHTISMEEKKMHFINNKIDQHKMQVQPTIKENETELKTKTTELMH